MTDPPYAPRFCRALLLLIVGAALHVPRPARTPIPTPDIRPMKLLAAAPPQGEPAVLVERSFVRVRTAPELIGVVATRNAEVPVGTTGLVADTPEPRSAPPSTLRTDAPAPKAMPAPAAAADPEPVSSPAVPETREAVPPIPVARTAALSSAASRSSEEELVRRLIDQYTGALERLDVDAAVAAWPTVDGKALKRAFGQLSAQRLTMESCGITISGSTANARCRGSASYQPRIGTRAVQLASREWTFDFSKQDTAWRIVNTFVR